MKSVAKRTVTVILSVILAVMCFVSCTKEKREASAVIEDIMILRLTLRSTSF